MNRTDYINSQAAGAGQRLPSRRAFFGTAAAAAMRPKLPSRRRTMRGIINLAENRCDWGGMEVACNLIREYDGQTGATHFEYAMPEETGNVNIWRVNADNSLIFATEQPNYDPTPKPTLPFLQTPTPTDDPVFPGGGILPAVRAIDPPATPPPATHRPPTPPATPTPPPPAPTPRREAAPPPGTFTYGAGRRYTTDYNPQATARMGSGGQMFTFSAITTGGGNGECLSVGCTGGGAGTGTGGAGTGTGGAGGAGGSAGTGTGGAGGSAGTGTGTERKEGDTIAGQAASGGGLFQWASDLMDEDGQVLTAIKAIPTWAWLAAGGAAVAAAATKR